MMHQEIEGVKQSMKEWLNMLHLAALKGSSKEP